MFFCTVAKAQEKKYVYTDSSLIQTEDGTDIYDSVAVSAPIQQAYEEDVKQEVVEIDTTLYYTSLDIPKDSIEAWKNLKGFGYIKYMDSLLKAKQDENNKRLKEQPDDTPSTSWLDRMLSSSGLQFFLWLLAVIFILFILYKLFLTEGVFRRVSASAKDNKPDVAEEIIDHESDFDALIRNAVQVGNFRLAIRYHYLQTLHLLAQKNQIQLATDKTNYQYVSEIVNKGYQNEFAALTLNYEYAWYGEFAIDELLYSKLKGAFVSFKNKI